MGFNRRKMADQLRQAVEKDAATGARLTPSPRGCRTYDRSLEREPGKAIADALLADDWRRDPRALLVSLGTLPSVPNNLSDRLRTLDRHREAAVTSLIPQFLPERSPREHISGESYSPSSEMRGWLMPKSAKSSAMPLFTMIATAVVVAT
jgi:hypothetical protein